jgi:hypothetical protein
MVRNLQLKQFVLRFRVFGDTRVIFYLSLLTIFAGTNASIAFASASDIQGPEARNLDLTEAKAIGSSPMYYLIEGVHYLLNERDLDAAEELFRKVIFSSSFSSLSRRRSRVADLEIPRTQRPEAVGTLPGSDRWVVAEAFYFLGKIQYDRASAPTEAKADEALESISLAKIYLEKAEEYGIVYDHLHPPMLEEINRRYPEAYTLVVPGREEAEVTFDIANASDGSQRSLKINAVKIDSKALVAEERFPSSETKNLECGARYKVEPDIQGGRRSIYRALTVVGIGIAVWLARD